MKSTDKQSEKRKAILEASLNLFCEKCFQDTSTASISQAANVGTGTLFCYFDSKEDLVNELYLQSKEEFAEYMENGVWEHKTFKTQLKHVLDRTIEWYRLNPKRITFMSQYRSSSLITKTTRTKAMERFTVIGDIIKKAVENGEASTTSVELLTALISGYFHMAAQFLMDNASEANLKSWQEEAFSVIWKGVN